jgi:hypothetical protein
MRAVCNTKGPHIAAPHNLPAKLLLRMRREDRATALARMDQPQLLRQLFSCIAKGLLAATVDRNSHAVNDRSLDRTRIPSRATTTGHRAARAINFKYKSNRSAVRDRAGLHLRRANKKGQTLFSPRARIRALLATQGSAIYASCRQTDNQRLITAARATCSCL